MGIHVKDKKLLNSLMDKYTIGEIVDEYLEVGKCSSADILNIADDFWTSPEDETPIEKIDNIIDEEEAKDVLKEKKHGYEWFKSLEKIVVCKDTDDVVYNIRNDYGKVTSYRNIGHGEEKDGIIYSATLK